MTGCVAGVVTQFASPALVALSSTVNLGSVQLGNATSVQVPLVNKSSVAVNVTQLSVSGPFSIVGQTSPPIPVAANSTYNVTVNFNPASAGPQTGQLSVATDRSPSSASVITLAGTGEADSPVPATLSAISCTTTAFTGAGTDSCTVTLNSAAPSGGVTVNLSSSGAGLAVPPTVTVPQNATTALFSAAVSAVATSESVQVIATTGGASMNFPLQLSAYVPALQISATTVSFGTVALNTPAIQSLTLTSTGTAPLTIASAALTGSGFSISGSAFPLTLNPAQSVTLNVQFDPTTAGASSGQLTIASNSSTNGTAVISLAGTATPRLTGISCNSASIGGTGTDVCTITISGAAPTGGFRVVLSSNNVALTVPSAALVQANATSAQFTANVTAVTTQQAAVLSGSDGTVTQSFALQLTVPVPTLGINVSSLTFVPEAINTPATQTVTLTSTGTAPVTISGVSVAGSGFTLAQGTFPLTLNPGQTSTISVQFDPLVQGAVTGQLTVSSNSSANGTAVIALSGTGGPQLSNISCSKASLSGAATDVCTVAISGPALAGGLRVLLASNSPSVTVPAVALVQANASSAQFTATVTAVSSPQTAILTASTANATQSFSLQLTAPVPMFSIGASSLNFGGVPVNTAATQTVTLNSTGTAPVTISGASVTGAGFTLAQGTFPLTLNPGQTTTLSVQFSPVLQGDASGQLTITSNSSSNSAAVIALIGTGGAQLSGLSCTSASLSGTATDLCTATINGPAPSAGFRVSISSNNPAVSVTSVALIHANSTSVQFSASVIPVSTAQTATLTASAGSITQSFNLQLNLPLPTLNFSVNTLSFGNVGINTAATQNVTFGSTGTGAVTISGATVTGAGFSLAQATFPIILNPGQTTTLGVQFNPAAEGATTGQLIVSSNSSTNTPATIALSATAEPQITGLSCSSPSVVATTTDICTVTISGPALSGGFRVVLSSNNAAVTVPVASLVLANANSAQFTVNSTPVTTAQTATLTASAGSVIQSYALAVNAALPGISTNVPNISFGNVPVNVTSTRSVTVTSSGAATLTISAVAVSGTGFTIMPGTFPVSLAPGQTIALAVQFNPSAQATSFGQLVITSNSSTNGTAAVVLSGTGTPPASFSYSGSPLTNTQAPPSPGTPISGNFFGMSFVHTATPFPVFPVSAVRFSGGVSWSTVEPSSDQFVWTSLDERIQLGQSNGVSDFIYPLGSVPTWASTDPTDPCTNGSGPGTCSPPNMAAFDDFLTNIVQRYCGTIKYYETWNEPNNPSFWDGTNAQLLTVAQQLYSIAKDPANCGCTNGVCAPNGGVNPNQVLMPPISHLSAQSLTWLDTYLSTAGPQYPYADIATFHGYDVVNPENIIPEVSSLNQVLANHGLSNLPLWNTEASWGALSSVDQDQAAWLMRYHLAQILAGVSRFVWYSYDDCGWGTLWAAPWCTNPQPTPTSQVTAPGQAYAVIESWLTNANLVGCNQYENGLWACELQRPGGYDGWMLWSSTGAQISVPIPETSNLLLYRDWQNNVNQMPTELTVNEMPVLLENNDL
jgi:hypothetical protein